MIYDKEASFPYPILSPKTNHYKTSELIFEIEDLKENSTSYIFQLRYSLGEGFIADLYEIEQIRIILIISSTDNYFLELANGQTIVEIPKSRLSLSTRTNLQLQLHANDEIFFKDCLELNDFFNEFKNEILIPRNSLVGYSAIETFLGTEKTSLILFERSINEEDKNPFEVELGERTILLKFNSSKYFLQGTSNNSSLMNMYYYVGLSRALEQFIRLLSNEDEEEVDLRAISQVQEVELHQKLLDLMLNKEITTLNFDNVDSVIHEISEQIVEKFFDGIIEVSKNGD